MSGSDSTTVDLSEFEALGRSASQPDKCIVARNLDRLEVEGQAKLHAALDADHIAHATISKWLKARGLSASDQVVRLHRKGECCCER